MIILALELGIFRAVVPLPELLLGVERRGVQALLAAERAHLVLDLAVVMAVRGAGRQRHGAPEAEVDVDLAAVPAAGRAGLRSEEHTSELQSHLNLVCRLLLEKKKKIVLRPHSNTQWTHLLW